MRSRTRVAVQAGTGAVFAVILLVLSAMRIADGYSGGWVGVAISALIVAGVVVIFSILRRRGE